MTRKQYPEGGTVRPTPQQILEKYKTNQYVTSGGRNTWGSLLDKILPYSGTRVRDTVLNAAKIGNVDPSLLYTSAMEEGLGYAINKPDDVSERYASWSTKNNELSQKFPVDGFYNYGLDTFSDQYKNLANKGYLPKDFDKRFVSYQNINEKNQKVNSAAFASDQDALIAKAAMIRDTQDQLNTYATNKKLKLSDRQKDFFTLAGYNGGINNMQKMIDSYNEKGYLKDDKFLDANFKPASYSSIYTNVQRRLQNRDVLNNEGFFANGGELPGPEDPPILKARTPNNFDPWALPENNTPPIPGNSTTQQYRVDPLQTTGQNVNNIIPLSQFYDQETDTTGYQTLNPSGKYVNEQGQIQTQSDLQDQVTNVNENNSNRASNMQKIEEIAGIGIPGLNNFLGNKQASQQQRTNLRKAIMNDQFETMFNPYSRGTGSQAIYEDGGSIPPGKKSYNPNLAAKDLAFQAWYKKNTIEGKRNLPYTEEGDYDYYSFFRNGDYKEYIGGHFPDTYKRPNHETFSNESIYSTPENPGGFWNGEQFNPNGTFQYESGGTIHIKPENRGKFTAAAKRAGKSVQAYAAQIMANPDNYSPTLRKRANFARNAAKWHEDGGEIDSTDQNIQVIDGGKAKLVSNSYNSNPMVEFTGKDHSEGGIGIVFGNQVAEVENGELGFVDQQGSLNIFGKLKVPGTGKTFKNMAKDLAKQEDKVNNNISLYLKTLNNGDPADSYQQSAISTAKVMFKSLDKQSKEINETKEGLADYQNLILGMVENHKAKMAYGGKLPKKGNYAEDGITLSNTPPDDATLEAALQAIFGNEKGKLGQKTSLKGSASGTYQMTNATVKDVWEKHYKKNFPKYETFRKLYDTNGTIEKATAKAHLSDLFDTYGEDLALGAWYSPAHAKRVLAGDKKALNEIPRPDYGNTKTFGQYLTGVMNNFDKARIKARIPVNTTDTTDTTNVVTANPNPTIAANNTTYLGDPNKGGVGVPSNSYKSTANNTTTNNSLIYDTEYGPAARQSNPLIGDPEIDNTQQYRKQLSPLALGQIAPELLTLATNKQDPVYQLSYQPELKQTFDISYQEGRNQNQSTFNNLAKIAESTGNIDALSQFAAQKYMADQQYTNQEIQGNAQNRVQTYNANVDTLNDAKVKNLALIADQQNKQAQAKFNTRKENISAISSISGKFLQNQLENRTYNAYANLFKNYGFDKYGNVTFDPGKVTQKFNEGEAQQFGMLQASKGASAIMNGDFSRKFTKVKNDDGSTTTTETFGTNQQIQSDYKALKAQGFDDDLIGNMLRAKYPKTVNQ